MKIYTRTGDQGETGLFGGGRVAKDHLRVEAYGEVDELNAALGLAIVHLDRQSERELAERLREIQADLFAIGAYLATPAGGNEGAARHLPPLPEGRIGQMEAWMDRADDVLPPLRNFILPGGSESAAWLHLARTVCRRAERRVVALTRSSEVPGTIVIYLNRLSDLLFTFARLANRSAGAEDVSWTGRQ
jgi:cob(I)alamin adenosyltransferase